MAKAILKWALIVGCLLAVGPLMARLLMDLRDPDGGRAVTLFINASTSRAAMYALAVLAAAFGVGVVGTRFFSLSTGMMCAGVVLAWASSSLGTLEEIVRRTGDGKTLPVLAVEGLFVTGVGALMAWTFTRVAARVARRSAVVEGGLPIRAAAGWMGAIAVGDADPRDHAPALAAAALGAGVFVALIFVWLLALSGGQMQTLAAATAGAIAAGAVVQLMSASRPFAFTPVLPIFALAIVALLGPFITKFVEGSHLLAHVYDGTVLNIARPLSLDWAAGALLGVPLGMSWGGAGSARRTA